MTVEPLDAVLGVLQTQPWAVRCRFAICRDGRSATIQCGGMLAVVSESSDGAVELAYENSLHELTREHLLPEMAARLLLAVIQREGLTRVEVPDA